MPLAPYFSDELKAVDRHLEEVQRTLASLKGQADLEHLPKSVALTLQRKHRVLALTREDLRRIPRQVAEAEARR